MGMRKFAGLIAGAWLAQAAIAVAGAEDPVVVELYTSQGCSSCPPADKLLGQLAMRDEVIPLALHVDYWDYIGWKDSFGDPAYTRRQRGYARAANDRTIYTPQMVIEGEDHVIGTHPRDVAELVRRHSAEPTQVTLDVSREGDAVAIRATSSERLGPSVVQLVRYLPERAVSISRGENAGRTITYHNIVTDWRVVDEWDGGEALSLKAEAPGEAGIVVIVQRDGYGPILAAARLR